MRCDLCGSEDDVFLIRRDGSGDEARLCRSCAAAYGEASYGAVGRGAADVEGGHPDARLEAFFGDLGDEPAPGPSPVTCPGCGLGRSEFLATGVLGCVRCVPTFRRDLASLRRRGGHGAPYAGKVPTGLGPAEGREGLAAALRAAIIDEDFERAAELRDRLKAGGGVP